MKQESFEFIQDSPTVPQRNWLSLGRVLATALLRQGLVCAVLALAAYGCFQFSQRYLLQAVQVQGCSMMPTLPDHQRYVLNRAVYAWREPKPMEIVVLRDPEAEVFAVKRVVARPGDSVYVTGGEIYVNGERLAEPYLAPGTRTYPDARYKAQLFVCGVDQYFVLGDNRGNSADSRIYGTVPRQRILGLVTP